MAGGKKLPLEITELWPEVLNDIEVNSVPIEYLKSIYVTFLDGQVWEILIHNRDLPDDEAARELEGEIEDLLDEYEETIDHIDFRLDTEKIKTDITKRTHIFMKKRK